MTEHCLLYSAPINDEKVSVLITYLNGLLVAQPAVTRLTIAVSSPGGNVNSGITAYSLLRALPFDIVTHNIGNVDSITNAIFLAGDTRLSNSAATFMFHGVGLTVGKDIRMEEALLAAYLQSVQSDNRRIAQIIADRSNLSLTESLDLFKQQTTSSAAWAKANGIISDISEFSIPSGADVKHLV